MSVSPVDPVVGTGVVTIAGVVAGEVAVAVGVIVGVSVGVLVGVSVGVGVAVGVFVGVFVGVLMTTGALTSTDSSPHPVEGVESTESELRSAVATQL